MRAALSEVGLAVVKNDENRHVPTKNLFHENLSNITIYLFNIHSLKYSAVLTAFYCFIFSADGTRASFVYGPSVQSRNSATVAEEDQAGGTPDSGLDGLSHRPEHGSYIAQLHGGPVPLFLWRVGTTAAAAGHVQLE